MSGQAVGHQRNGWGGWEGLGTGEIREHNVDGEEARVVAVSERAREQHELVSYYGRAFWLHEDGAGEWGLYERLAAVDAGDNVVEAVEAEPGALPPSAPRGGSIVGVGLAAWVDFEAERRGPGRPPLDPADRRSERFSVRVTPATKATIEALAARHGASQADLVTRWAEVAARAAGLAEAE